MIGFTFDKLVNEKRRRISIKDPLETIKKRRKALTKNKRIKSH